MRYCLGSLIFLLFTAFACAGGEFILAEKGKAKTVVIGQKAAEACKVLNSYLAKMGLAPLKAVPSPEKAGKLNKIQFSFRSVKRIQDEDVFSFSFPDKTTLLISCTEKSALWAINHLLEEYGGIQHLFPEECGTSIPVKNRIVIPRRSYRVAPSWDLKRFVERSHPSWYKKVNYNDELEANHMFLKYVFPAAKYQPSLLKRHAYPNSTREKVTSKGIGWPKEIMPILKGKKLTAPPERNPNAFWQPCYTNAATVRIAVENILEFLAANPNQKTISLIQNDCEGVCECKECMRVNRNDKYNNSETYFRWADQVAGQVAKKYPHVIFTVAGYTLSKTPPSFKLHKNIAVLLSLDLYACTAPSVMAAKKKYIDQWAEKASLLGIWDYAWGWGYVLPRVYFHVHAEMLRYFYKKGGRIYFSENECFDAKEGPKQALTDRLVWDMDTDVDKFLTQWCENAVGKKAGKYLLAYYKYWEKFMGGEEIKKTPWFRTAYTSVYMLWDGDLSHLYAVSEKELAASRALMDKVLALAGSAQEKERARLLYRHFEYMEVILRLYGATLLPPSNIPENVSRAAAFIRDMKNIPQLLRKRDQLKKEFFAEKKMGFYYQSRIYKRRIRFEATLNEIVTSRLSLIMDFSGEKLVADACKELLQMPGLNDKVHGLLEGVSTFAARKNLLENGDMEKGLPPAKHFWVHPSHRRKGSGVLSTDFAASGKNSLKVRPGDYTLLRFNVPAKPNTGYLVSFKVNAGKGTAKGNIAYAVYPSMGERNQGWGSPARKKIPAGQFKQVFFFTRTRPTSNAVNGFIFLRDFAPGESVYIDDVKLIEFK